MGVDSKTAILQNNFQTESESLDETHKGAQSAVGAHGDAPSGVRVVEPAPADALTKKKRGPKTNAGKKAVSRNALKHAIFSPHPVIIEGLETIEDWEKFESEIVESWATEGRYEQELAERIAFLLWRLRRCRHHETAVLNHQVQRTGEDLSTGDAYLAGRDAEVPDPDPDRVAAFQQLRIIPGELSIDRIMRYETHVHRLLVSTIHELEARQAARRGERVTLGRFDFNSVQNLGPQRSATPSLAAAFGDGK